MLLNGSSSRAVTTGLGGVSSGSTGAFTMAAIVRRNATGAWHNVVGLLDSGNNSLVDLTFSDTNVLTMEGNSAASAGPTLSTTGWYFVAADKASGTVAARFHRQKYGTDAAVTHSAGSGNLNSGGGTNAKVGIGTYGASSDWFNGDIMAVAVWNRQLSDAEHDSLAANLTNWHLLNPDWLIFGDYADALPANIPDLSGKGAPLTTLTNLAVSTQSMLIGYGAPELLSTRQPGTGSQTITPGTISSAEQLFAPTFAPGAVTVTPGTINAASQVFAPTLNQIITPGFIASTEQVFAPSLAMGSVTITPGTIGSAEQVFAPSLAGSITVNPGTISSAEQVFAPTFAMGSITITPGFLASGAQVYQPSLAGGDVVASKGQRPTLGVG